MCKACTPHNSCDDGGSGGDDDDDDDNNNNNKIHGDVIYILAVWRQWLNVIDLYTVDVKFSSDTSLQPGKCVTEKTAYIVTNDFIFFNLTNILLV